MKTIEDIAIQTYQNNLAYLEKNHPSLHEQLSTLDVAIAQGLYQERYALEYKDEGYFDVYEIDTKQYLYNENSLLGARRVIENYNLKRTGGVFKAQKYCNATDEQAEAIDKSELSFHNSLWATIKLINYTKKYTHDQTCMQKSNKVIFLGIGLGLYIEGIIKKLNAKVIFIKEQNIELFRLSLFVTDFKKAFADCTVYFSLANDEHEEREQFIKFLNTGNNYNLNIKHIPFTLDYQKDLQKLQSHVLSQSYINYGYSAILLRYIDSPKYLVENYAFINLMKRYHGVEGNILSEKPVLMVFSGPSTLKNIEWIKTNRDKFIVVSALSTCRLLHSHDLKPNIVIHIDPGENSSLLFEELDEQSYFKDVITILASNTDRKTVNRFQRKNIYFIEQGTTYKQGFGNFSAPSVGEYTLGIMMVLGVSDLYMLGVDLALDADTLQTHGGHHPFKIAGQLDTKSASLDPRSSAVYIRGNFRDQIPTLETYKISIEQVKIFIQTLKKEHHHIYNLSDGAYLEGCEPLKIESHDWAKKEKLMTDGIQEKIALFFESISEAQFNSKDRLQIKYQINEAKKLEKLIKQHQKKKFVNSEAYLSSLAKLSWNLSDMEYKTNSNLAQVYYEYFSIVMSYIFDLFNTQDLANPDKHIIEIDKILVHQLLKISNLYINKLENYLK